MTPAEAREKLMGIYRAWEQHTHSTDRLPNKLIEMILDAFPQITPSADALEGARATVSAWTKWHPIRADGEELFDICENLAYRIAAFASACAAAERADEREQCARECNRVAWSNKNTAMLGPEQNALRCEVAIRARTP